MEIQALLLSLGIGLAFVTAGLGVFLVARSIAGHRVRERLQDVVIVSHGDDSVRAVVLRDLDFSTIPLINDILRSADWARRLDILLVQGDISMRVGSFLGVMGLSGVVGMVLTATVGGQPLLALPVGVLFAFIPYVWARHRKTKRVRQFERQFPDSLDMLTSALRAGLAFSGAIQVVADESPDPVGHEFRVLFEENRLGLDMRDGLKKLAERVDSAELRLFVTAVILQRETGGNLAEVLEGTAAVIRDRFRILGDVRTLTAQAKLSGFVLMILPLFMAVFIMFVAPDYLKGMMEDPLGKYLVGGAVFLQIAGFLIMRRIVNIKV